MFRVGFDLVACKILSLKKGTRMPNFTGMPAATADQYRAGMADVCGNPPEQQISDGDAPYRCCLRMIAQGKPMLVLAYRPFKAVHAYAETGPVFLCADHCAPAGTALPCPALPCQRLSHHRTICSRRIRSMNGSSMARARSPRGATLKAMQDRCLPAMMWHSLI